MRIQGSCGGGGAGEVGECACGDRSRAQAHRLEEQAEPRGLCRLSVHVFDRLCVEVPLRALAKLCHAPIRRLRRVVQWSRVVLSTSLFFLFSYSSVIAHMHAIANTVTYGRDRYSQTAAACTVPADTTKQPRVCVQTHAHRAHFHTSLWRRHAHEGAAQRRSSGLAHPFLTSCQRGHWPSHRQSRRPLRRCRGCWLPWLAGRHRAAVYCSRHARARATAAKSQRPAHRQA